MQAVNHTVEVERLYDELRECLQANDQAGAQRIFAELVRAKRPLAEIVGEVKRLSRGSTRSELDPEPSTASEHSITEEWRQPDIPPQSATAAPEPAPALTYASVPSTSTPAAGPSNPAETA